MQQLAYLWGWRWPLGLLVTLVWGSVLWSHPWIASSLLWSCWWPGSRKLWFLVPLLAFLRGLFLRSSLRLLPSRRGPGGYELLRFGLDASVIFGLQRFSSLLWYSLSLFRCFSRPSLPRCNLSVCSCFSFSSVSFSANFVTSLV